jgi:hypothetical protein
LIRHSACGAPFLLPKDRTSTPRQPLEKALDHVPQPPHDGHPGPGAALGGRSGRRARTGARARSGPRRPLPPRTAVVVGSADLSRGAATVTLGCPAGHRVADLLPPRVAGVTAGYVRATHPGLSQSATVALSGTHSRDVGVAVLCRVPGPDGALTSSLNASARGATAASVRPPAVACVGRDYLRSSPAGMRLIARAAVAHHRPGTSRLVRAW